MMLEERKPIKIINNVQMVEISVKIRRIYSIGKIEFNASGCAQRIKVNDEPQRTRIAVQ